MPQTFLSLGAPCDSSFTACVDPFQVNLEACYSVSTVDRTFFGYDNERNECREIKNTVICDLQKFALFNTIEECAKCVQLVDGISETQKEIVTCFDNPCTDLCVTNLYTANCFVPPCPQYRCVTSDEKIKNLLNQ